MLRYGDGWMPLGFRGAEGLAEEVASLRSQGEEAGRGHIPVVQFGCMEGDDAVEAAVEAGVDSLIFIVPSEPESVVVPLLDAYAEQAAKFG